MKSNLQEVNELQCAKMHKNTLNLLFFRRDGLFLSMVIKVY